MADGRWTMTEGELNDVAGGFNLPNETLPNRGRRKAVDDRDRSAAHVCAFCGSANVEAGTGGYGAGLGYHSLRCADCGGQTDLVYKDEFGKYLE